MSSAQLSNVEPYNAGITDTGFRGPFTTVAMKFFVCGVLLKLVHSQAATIKTFPDCENGPLNDTIICDATASSSTVPAENTLMLISDLNQVLLSEPLRSSISLLYRKS